MLKCVRVLDLANLSLAHADRRMIDIMRQINSVLAYKYPEGIERIYVINAPFVFSMIFSVVRTFLHPITADKFCVCASDYASQARCTLHLAACMHPSSLICASTTPRSSPRMASPSTAVPRVCLISYLAGGSACSRSESSCPTSCSAPGTCP